MNKAHTEKLKRTYNRVHPLANPAKAEIMEAKESLGNKLDTPEDWKEYLQSKKLVAAKHLVEEVQGGKVTAIEAFFKLLGEFIEKSEHKVEFELSAADHIRIDRESDRRIQEALGEAGGGESLPKEPGLLSD